MYTYPNRTSGKAPSCYLYIFLAIDGLFALILIICGIICLILFKLYGLPIFLLTLGKGFAIYNSFVCLTSPEKVKPNRTYYLSFSVINTAINTSVFLFICFKIAMTFSTINTSEIPIIILYILVSGSLSTSAWMILFYIKDLINSESSYARIPQVMSSYHDFRYIMN